MWMTALAGAIVLVFGTVSLASEQQELPASNAIQESAVQPGPVVTESHIAGLKSALRLTPEQHAHWGPVESALRALARQQRRDVAAAGFVQRMSERASSVAGTAIQLRRLAAVSRPLIGSLGEEQKGSAMQLIRRHGFERLLAMF